MFKWIVCDTLQYMELFNFLDSHMFTNHIYLIYMYKLDLALNNLQWLICHKTKSKPNQDLLCCTHHAFFNKYFINIIWFALPNHQKFNDRSLFKPGAFGLIFHHFEQPQNKYFSKIKIFFSKPNSNQWSVYIYGTKFWKKLIFLFIKKYPLFIEWPS